MQQDHIDIKSIPVNKYEHARSVVLPTIKRFGSQRFKLLHIAEANAQALEDVSRVTMYKAFNDEIAELEESGVVEVLVRGKQGRSGIYKLLRL